MSHTDIIRKSLDITPKADFDRHDSPIILPSEIRVDDDIWLPWFPRQLFSQLSSIIFPLLWIIYSIAAFIYDFKAAKVVFGLNIFFAIILFFVFMDRYMGDRLENFYTNMQDTFEPKWKKTSTKFVFYFLLFGAFIACIIPPAIDEPKRLISGIGLITFVLLSWILSWKPTQVSWRPVLWGLGLQFVFALIILRTDAGFRAFEWIGDICTGLLGFTEKGSSFVFGYLATGYFDTFEDKKLQLFGPFAFSVLPTVIYFSSLVSMLYYLGILQSVIRVIGAFMAFTLGTSASESLNAAGNIFVGQTEAPLLVKPFLKTMTRSELHAVMTGGFATIAGGVLAIYIKFGVSAPHLIASSVMSAPAALAISKLMYPETEESETKGGKISEIDSGKEANLIEAAANGAAIAVSLAANIAGMLISFLAVLALFDYLLGYFGGLIGWGELSFEYICGYLFYPFAFLMGVDGSDCRTVGKLIGLKIFTNEFVAYERLLEYKVSMSERSVTIATYALCGFANFGSIGIQLGGFGPLAPNRRSDMAKIVMSAMIAGNIACFMTASIAGLLYDANRS